MQGCRDVVSERRRSDDLDVVAPGQDPQPDLDGAGDRGAPVQCAVGLDGDRLGRVPRRLEDSARDAGREAEHDLHRLLVGDDVPRRGWAGLLIQVITAVVGWNIFAKRPSYMAR